MLPCRYNDVRPTLFLCCAVDEIDCRTAAGHRDSGNASATQSSVASVAAAVLSRLVLGVASWAVSGAVKHVQTRTAPQGANNGGPSALAGLQASPQEWFVAPTCRCAHLVHDGGSSLRQRCLIMPAVMFQQSALYCKIGKEALQRSQQPKVRTADAGSCSSTLQASSLMQRWCSASKLLAHQRNAVLDRNQSQSAQMDPCTIAPHSSTHAEGASMDLTPAAWSMTLSGPHPSWGAHTSKPNTSKLGLLEKIIL